MSRTPTERTIVLTANEPAYLPVSGDYVNLRVATSSVQIAVNDGDFVTYNEDETVRSPFDRLALLSTVTQTVTVLYGPGEFQGNEVSATITGTIDQELGDTVVENAVVSALAAATTAVVGSDVSRKSVAVSLLSTAASHVFVGGVGVTTGEGVPLEPGTTLFFSTTGALSVYNPSASAVDVYSLIIDKA